MASSETPPPSLRQGVRIAPHDSSVSVEEALLAAGEQVGHGNLVFASRVNKAVLVFVKSEQMVHQLVASGVIIRDLYVQVSPLSVPSTRVTVSGVPPFIPNELLEVELRRFGKFASGFKTMWALRKSEFGSLMMWWEVGKAHIRVFCQQYTSHSTSKLKAAVEDLETSIRDLELGLQRDSNPSAGQLLQKKRLELSSFLQERVKGALVRCRFLEIKEMDAPTPFFFNLERSVAQRKQMSCLKLPGGRVTSSPEEMRDHAMDFYTNLFGGEQCSIEGREEILEGLPQLSPEEKAALDLELTLEELTEAVNQMASGRAPGIDGLSGEFLKHFWGVLGADLRGVFAECFRTGSLPVSCRRAVLSLLPKKGDLALLKNWRPVALLTVDYKVLSRALSNRLKGVLEMVIQQDQTYCIPDRSIMDNIFFMRDVMDVCRAHGVNVGVVSLDQEKAFDRVDHLYLFSALRAYGIGEGFLAWVGLLYNGAQCLVKMGAGLSRPIPVQRGIRQGCPISGQLYSLAIEPLLCRLRSKLSGLSLPASCGLECPPTLSAYADDISIFVSSQRDVQCLQDTLSLYERASSARVNWAKSSALLFGCWREQVVPSLPGGLQWETEGLKVLGVFLGTEAFKARNWEGAKEKVCARLSKWKWLLPHMSYRGRVLVANTLVASTLWHRLMALTPPRNLVSSIQQEIVDFFWSGRHWVRAAALYLPLAEGGQGLICIQSKIASFRLRTVSRLLYDCGPSWLNFGKLLLRSVGRFGYHKQLFLLNPEELDLSGLTPFYTSVLQAWHTFKFTRATSEMPGMWVFEEPLFFNVLLRARTLQSASLRTSLREAGCTKVGHLMKAKATSLEALRRRSNTSSIRILDQVVKEVCAALPESLRAFAEDADLCEQWLEDGDYSFPSLEVTPAVGDWHEGAGQLLTLRTPHLGTFQACGKKETYNLCVKVLNLRSLAGVRESRWAEFLGPDSSPKGSWRCLYKLPVEKRTADLQWRIVHGAIATNRYRAHLDPELGEGCIFCSEVETLEHLFVQCPRLSALFVLLKSWFQGLGEEFSFILFIFGPKYSAKKKGVHTLLNFLSGAAKMSIWLTRRNRVQGVGSVALLPVLRGLLKARLRVEYTYYHLMDNIQAFSHMWAVGGCLCSVGGDGELRLHI
ncbi:hypothetical protein NHX12_027711 [Muraenolepis orangiensis]|uniref:Reverse transcriptase domain-containing protein n=1 Tax=Muraenolepis orangiensis TaxID=630683 RepID=A0A9Q0IQP9_9TELE|nr:hypothetical protein NHX12_027711 [Muraenolepis orangiensis]